MIKNRLIGVVTVLDDWAVQSIGYRKYLPLGNPKVIVKNLDNWGADEIFILSINRSKKNLGPDLPLIRSVTNSSISTPLIYGGGINSLKQAEDCIKSGCERISVDYLLHNNPKAIRNISATLGCQSIIASIPLFIDKGNLFWYDYHQKSHGNNFDVLQKIANENQI